MTNFWTSFFAGVASTIVVLVLSSLIRRVLRRRAKGEPIGLSIKEWRLLAAIVIGFALIFIDIFLVSDGGVLKGIGAVMLIWCTLELLP